MKSASVDERDRQSSGPLQEDAARAAKLMALGQMTTSKILDLRQPLSVIATDCGTGLLLLQNGVSDVNKLRTIFERICDCITWANGVIAELDDAISSRVINASYVDVGEIITTAVRFVSCESVSRGVKVRKEFRPNAVNVSGDKEQLTQAFLGLMVNLIRSMRDTSGAELLLVGETVGQYLQVSLTVATERVYKFPPMVVFGGNGQVESSSYLQACKTIIRLHHGEIAAIDNERKFGFAVTLPVSEKSEIKDQ
ncbi:hypothetical protein [Agrobacterium sp.]|uniref:hypothetical protein n=1 Tax=Agrobacterium sp. TaxID=361 RepID=UPI0028A7C7E1